MANVEARDIEIPSLESVVAGTGAAQAGATDANQASPGAEEQFISVVPGQDLVIQFDPGAAVVSLEKADLVFAFPDGARIVFADFASATGEDGNLPNIAFPDGTLLPGADIVAQLAAIDAPQPFETAAGNTAIGGGGSEYVDDLGQLIDGLSAQGVIDSTVLDFDLVEFNDEIALAPLGSGGEGSQESGDQDSQLFAPTVAVTDGGAIFTVVENLGSNDPQTDAQWIGDTLKERKALPEDMINGVETDLHMQGAAPVTVEFLAEGAGYHNMLGWYQIIDGQPIDPQIVWVDASASRGDLINSFFGEQSEIVALNGGEPLPAGTDIGFFLVQDAMRYRPNKLFMKTLAKDYDSVEEVNEGESLQFNEEGHLVIGDYEFKQNVYFSHDPQANPDDIEHTVSGITEDGDGWFYLGFEDLFRGGDNDFNDVVFRVDLGDYNFTQTTAQILDPSIILDDADGDILVSAIAQAANLQDGDQLIFDSSLLSDTGISATAIIEGGEGGHVTGYQFEGEGSLLNFQDILNSVDIVLPESDVEEGTRNITFQVTDSDGQDSNLGVVSFDVDITTLLDTGPIVDVS